MNNPNQTPTSATTDGMPDSDFNRVILIDKPAGITSFGVVARVRRHLTELAGHKVKVGHCGTLDPFATGLLILASGKYTRRAQEFSHLDKVYRATIRLGATSTTGDPEGEITEQSVNHRPALADIERVLLQFTGEITQTPPAYSAIKINGQRAYKLARAGKAVEMPSRQVTIYWIRIISYSYPELVIETKVSSGTYIRTLAEDIGKALKTGAYTTALRRLSIGDFNVKDAHSCQQGQNLIR